MLRRKIVISTDWVPALVYNRHTHAAPFETSKCDRPVTSDGRCYFPLFVDSEAEREKYSRYGKEKEKRRKDFLSVPSMVSLRLLRPVRSDAVTIQTRGRPWRVAGCSAMPWQFRPQVYSVERSEWVRVPFSLASFFHRWTVWRLLDTYSCSCVSFPTRTRRFSVHVG